MTTQGCQTFVSSCSRNSLQETSRYVSIYIKAVKANVAQRVIVSHTCHVSDTQEYISYFAATYYNSTSILSLIVCNFNNRFDKKKPP